MAAVAVASRFSVAVALHVEIWISVIISPDDRIAIQQIRKQVVPALITAVVIGVAACVVVTIDMNSVS